MKNIDLENATRKVIDVCLGVQQGEQVLIVTDTLHSLIIPEALFRSAIVAGADAALITFQARERSPCEPPYTVAEAICGANAAILYTTTSLSHSEARIKAQACGTRIISAPGLSDDGFIRTLSADIPALAKLTNHLAEVVGKSRHVCIRTLAGTHISLELAHPIVVSDGMARKRGELDFFPPGLIINVPLTGTVNGTAVVDGAITHLGTLANSVTISFKAGRIADIRGGLEADRLNKLLGELDDPNAYEFSMWGIGTNMNAELGGENPAFEGERVYGWAHLSTGSNSAFPGGSVRAKIHMDLIIKNPRVELDGRVILEDRTFSE